MAAKVPPRRAEAKKRIMAAFGAHLKLMAAAHKIEQQRELAALSKIGEGSISRLLSGTLMPSLEHLAMLALALRCDPEDLIPKNLANTYLGQDH